MKDYFIFILLNKYFERTFEFEFEFMFFCYMYHILERKVTILFWLINKSDLKFTYIGMKEELINSFRSWVSLLFDELNIPI